MKKIDERYGFEMWFKENEHGMLKDDYDQYLHYTKQTGLSPDSFKEFAMRRYKRMTESQELIKSILENGSVRSIILGKEKSND